MNVVVCVKQIPDPADPGALDPETRTLKRDVKLILDESDSYGVEMALQLVDAAGEGGMPKTMRAFQMRGTPSMLLIDKTGRVVRRNIHSAELDSELQRLLK